MKITLSHCYNPPIFHKKGHASMKSTDVKMYTYDAVIVSGPVWPVWPRPAN